MGLFDLDVFFALPISLVVFDVSFAFGFVGFVVPISLVFFFFFFKGGIGGCGFVLVVIVGIVVTVVVVPLLLLMTMRMIGSN